MKYHIRHTTVYRYSDPVPLGQNETRLTPRRFARQECPGNQLLVQPPPATSKTRTDYFGNLVSFFALEEDRQLTVTRSARSTFSSRSTRGRRATPAWESVRISWPSRRDAESLGGGASSASIPPTCGEPRLAEYAAFPLRPAGRCWMRPWTSRHASIASSNTIPRQPA